MRIDPSGDQDTSTPNSAAAEIARQIEPLIELAHKNRLNFLAYLLSMAAEEARRIPTRVPGLEQYE